jgi:hypothetical protein
MQFNPDIELKTRHSERVKAFLKDESTIAPIQADDTEDRILKKSLDITVETYIPSPRFLYTSTGKIEELNFDLEITE